MPQGEMRPFERMARISEFALDIYGATSSKAKRVNARVIANDGITVPANVFPIPEGFEKDWIIRYGVTHMDREITVGHICLTNPQHKLELEGPTALDTDPRYGPDSVAHKVAYHFSLPLGDIGIQARRIYLLQNYNKEFGRFIPVSTIEKEDQESLVPAHIVRQRMKEIDRQRSLIAENEKSEENRYRLRIETDSSTPPEYG